MFGFLFLNTVSKLKRKKLLKRTPHLCVRFNKTSTMSLVVFFIFSLVFTLSVNHGVALSFAKKLPALSVANQSFLYTTGSEISRYTLAKLPLKLLSGLNEARYLEVAPVSDQEYLIFWSESKGNVIKKASLKNNGIVNNSIEVVAEGMSSVSGMFVDVVGENLFWLNERYSRLEVAKFDGSMRMTLLNKLNNVTSLTGDSYAGLLFWSYVERNGTPILERSYVDGSDARVIYKGKNGGETIEALSVNQASKKIYWIDKRSRSMFKSSYDGSSLEVVGESETLTSVVSFSVLNEFDLFWVQDDISSGVLVQVDADNFERRKTLTLNRPFMYEAKFLPLYNRARSLASDSCQRTGGRCSHACLRGANGGTSCFCPYGYEMSSDNESCQVHGAMLAYAGLERRSSVVNMHFVKRSDPEKWIYPPFKMEVDDVDVAVTGIASDLEKDEIFWISQSLIMKRSLVKGFSSLVLNLSYFEPKSLDFDWKSETLYILSALNGNSSVLSTCTSSGHQFSHLIWRDMRRPLELAIDSVNRKLFWSHSDQYSFLIEMADANGQNRQVFLNSEEHSRSLVTDSNGKRLCWLKENLINCKSYEGKAAIETPRPVTDSPLTFMSSFNGVLMVSNELGVLQTVNLTGSATASEEALSLNTFLSVRYISVSSNSQKEARSANLAYLERSRVLSSSLSDTPPFLVYLTRSEPHSLSLNDEYQPELLPNSLLSNLTLTSRLLSNETIDKVEFSNYGDVNTLFWVDGTNSINSVGMDGKDVKVLLQSDDVIGGIAVDSVLGNIYWTLPLVQKIMVADKNLRFPLVLHDFGRSQAENYFPTAITLDGDTGNVFFVACREETCDIHQSSSENRVIPLRQTQTMVGDLTVEGNYLYWSEPVIGAIHSLNLRTRFVETIVQSNPRLTLGPTSLVVYEDALYWTDSSLNQGSIIKKRFHDDEMKVMRNASHVGKLLRISQRKNGSRFVNPCLDNNGGCSHLCIYRTDARERCFCSFGQLVLDGEGSCQGFDSYLLIADNEKILSLDYRNLSRANPPLPTIKPGSNLNKIVTLAFNQRRHRIYFSDLKQKPYIFSIFPNGTDLKAELRDSDRERHVEGMTYDAIVDALFWTESYRPSIWSLKDSVEKELFSLGRKDKPRGIAVHACSRRLFWTNVDKIESGSLSGQNRTVVVSRDLEFVSGLAIFDNELYWTNKKEDGFLEFYIEKSRLDGTHRLILISGEHRRPFALIATANSVFWTDKERNVLCQSSLDVSSSKKSCDEVSRHLRDPFGILIVSKEKLICDGNYTKYETTVVHVEGNSSSPNDIEPLAIQSHSPTFKKLIISISVLFIGAALVAIVLMIRRKNRRDRLPKCATIKQPPLGRKTTKQEEYQDCKFKVARSNPSFELDDVFCSDILEEEEDGTLIDS